MVKAKVLFDEFMRKGNLVSAYRRSELQQLEDMLAPYLVSYTLATPTTTDVAMSLPPQREAITDMVSEDPEAAVDLHNEVEGDMISLLMPGDDFHVDTLFTTAQIMDIANSIGETDHAWMSETIVKYDIW